MRGRERGWIFISRWIRGGNSVWRRICRRLVLYQRKNSKEFPGKKVVRRVLFLGKWKHVNALSPPSFLTSEPDALRQSKKLFDAWRDIFPLHISLTTVTWLFFSFSTKRSQLFNTHIVFSVWEWKVVFFLDSGKVRKGIFSVGRTPCDNGKVLFFHG